MQHQANGPTRPVIAQVRGRQRTDAIWRYTATLIVVGLVIFLALYNLTETPATWFDEGSHLHVPKALVRFGVYADYSSDGFRYYGPTVGLGPTVMLPIAAVFWLFGIGLLQARLVMVIYLLAAIYAFYRLARELGGKRLACVATALLIASRGVSLLEYGRQVLGEVPGLLFMIAGLVLWFAAWERANWRRLGLVGLLLGLATVTKQQYLLILAPTLGLAWLANLVYYRTAPQRVFIVPGLITAACFALWQVCTILYLGPATASENLTMLRESVARHALVFNPDLMKQSVKQLLSFEVYLGALVPVLAYGFILALPRRREGHQWGTLLMLVVVNLGWYAFASIGWLRYAFPGLAITSLIVARLFYDLTDGLRLEKAALWKALCHGQPMLRKYALCWAILAWLIVMIALPLGQTVRQIVWSGFNAADNMATYLDKHVPRGALIETYEPEMGFFTDHNYHFPPRNVANKVTAYVFLGGPPPAQEYHFVQTKRPDYVIVGPAGDTADLYPADLLAPHYRLVTDNGAYRLYAIDE